VRALAACFGLALVVALTASASPQQSTGVFSVDRNQAKQVAAIVDFVNAWNTRQLNKALALLAPGAGMSDCDYRRHRAVISKGKTQIAAWLRKRFADRDNLAIGRIWNEVPYQDEAAGVDYELRVNVLFPDGIVPKVQTKVVFARSGRIAGFANGPGGAPVDQQTKLCSP
jgi:hypothetical protein